MKFFSFFLCFIFFYSCNETTIHYKSTFFEIRNNILYFKNSPYSGLLIDTLSSEYIRRTNYVNGFKNGLEVSFYMNLDTASVRYYNKGVKVGVHKGWWPNKNLKYLLHFNDKGDYHGVINEWYFDGKLFKKNNYKNGREHGRQKLWDDKGTLKANYYIDENSERFGLIGIKKCYSTSINQ